MNFIVCVTTNTNSPQTRQWTNSFSWWKKWFSPSCSCCGWNEGRFQIRCLCVYLRVTLQRVWALEGEQPGSGERGQWRGSTPRSRVHADHQAAGPQTHPRCHYWEHHQKIWHTLSAYSYTWRYLSRGAWSFEKNDISIDARRENLCCILLSLNGSSFFIIHDLR